MNISGSNIYPAYLADFAAFKFLSF